MQTHACWHNSRLQRDELCSVLRGHGWSQTGPRRWQVQSWAGGSSDAADPRLAARDGSPLPFPGSPPAASSWPRQARARAQGVPIPTSASQEPHKPPSLLRLDSSQRWGSAAAGRKPRASSEAQHPLGPANLRDSFALASRPRDENDSLISSVSVSVGLRICRTCPLCTL